MTGCDRNVHACGSTPYGTSRFAIRSFGETVGDANRCGTMSNLEVHHREFRSQSRDDSEQNLITLCAACHTAAHLR